MAEIHAALDDVIRDKLDDIAEARERACESMLATGLFGVLEEWGVDADGHYVRFSLSSSVPYGQIHVKGSLF